MVKTTISYNVFGVAEVAEPTGANLGEVKQSRISAVVRSLTTVFYSKNFTYFICKIPRIPQICCMTKFPNIDYFNIII